MTVSLAAYRKLLLDRPRKFDAEEVNYRESEASSPLRCSSCLHFYRRATDGFATCEIFRDDTTDENGIDPAFVCDFFTIENETFPLLEDK